MEALDQVNDHGCGIVVMRQGLTYLCCLRPVAVRVFTNARFLPILVSLREGASLEYNMWIKELTEGQQEKRV